MADKPVISTKKKWREEDAQRVQIGAAEVIFKVTPFKTVSHEDPTWQTHPTEDAFQHPEDAYRSPSSPDELYAAPKRYLTANDLASNRAPAEFDPLAIADVKGTPEEHQALHTFLNMASAAERTPSVGDNVVMPKHYARFNIEPIRFICENNLNFFQANIVKYILRWDAKNGLEDLRKAKRYLEMFIKFVQKDPDWWQAA